MRAIPGLGLPVVALLILAACSGPDAPSRSPAAPTASATSTASTGPSGSPVAPSPAAASGFAADDVAQATVDRLRLHETPGTAGKPLGTLALGSTSIVVDGPTTAEGYDWYLLSGLGLPHDSGCVTGPDSQDPWTCPVWLGWAAARSLDGDEWLRRAEPECADPAGSLIDFTFQARYAYIACYGNRQLTLRGRLVVQVGTPVQDPCPEVPQTLRWLGCTGMYQLVGSADASASGMLLALKGSLPGDDPRIEVTGHYDDPAARQCTYGSQPEQSVLSCRSQFVVDSARPSGG
jgi:hypothetical protein